MGKLILVALTTVDGCLSNLKGIKEWGLKRSAYGITDLYNKADFIITKEMKAEAVEALRKDTEGYCLYEPELDMEKLTRKLFERRIVDELYLYVFSYTVGSGFPLFPLTTGASNYWNLKEALVYNEEILRLHYIWVNPEDR